MQLLNPTAVTSALGVVFSKIQNIAGLSKPVVRFLVWIIERWISLPLRHNFTALARYGGYSDKAIRNRFSSKLPFLTVFDQLFGFLKQKICIAAFDPTFIPKTGDRTHEVGKFWNGSAQRVQKGLEAGCLAIVDTEARTAYSMEVVQSPAPDGTPGKLIGHYCTLIARWAAHILRYTTLLAVDGYFMKKSFVDAALAAGLQLITKARVDADMRYLYNGPQRPGRGRPKMFAGKVDFGRIDKRRWRKIYEDDGLLGWEAVLWSVRLKRRVKVVYVISKSEAGYQVLVCTDQALAGKLVVDYYRLRFQIEFVIRDAKSHCGMEQCQARGEAQLYNHLNLAISTVSILKGFVWRPLRKHADDLAFSMQAIKAVMINKMLTERIFQNLGLDQSSTKIKTLYKQCLSFGLQAA